MYNYLIYKSILFKELLYRTPIHESPLLYSIFFELSEHFFDSSFLVILRQKCDIIS